MLDIPFDQFAKYYKIDEMSESDENDFEDDGRTLRSSENSSELDCASEKEDNYLM